MRNTNETRYRALDGYRAIAACLVMLYHYNMDFRLGLEGWTAIVPRLHLLVDFFFILSGFVVMTSWGDRIALRGAYREFLVRRLARLYPLHLLVLAAFLGLAVLAVAGWVKPNHPEHLALSALPANLLLIQSWGVVPHPSFNVPSWSISAEWLAYLLFPLAALIARRVPVGISFLGLAAAVTALFLIRRSAGLGPWTEATFDLGALRALPSFCAGVLLAQIVASRATRSAVGRGSWARAHLCAALALALTHFGAPDEAILVVFGLLVLVAALAERGGASCWLMKPAAQRLGAASYAIYMIHILAAIPVLFVLRRSVGLGAWQADLAAVATALLVVAAAIVLHRSFELPLQRRLTGSTSASRDRIATQPA